ncbi:hypothetical protein E2562_036560 [Oryza meyeriana var. granulata]|uniref:Uncharacterized protein n=1 Tax=Oryza meyeriana var. granulata TaxID=110450 RepID=A0A6G1EDB9_9ORYZ|nr:hypothetical protein E2562_036560 [Oryza meyeriana var. granulata]
MADQAQDAVAKVALDDINSIPDPAQDRGKKSMEGNQGATPANSSQISDTQMAGSSEPITKPKQEVGGIKLLS